MIERCVSCLHGGLIPMRALAVVIALALAPAPSRAETGYEAWPPLTNPFPSTGGGGVMIDGYAPVVAGGRCDTPFRALTPDGATYENFVTFDAEPTQGGVLCRNGRWRSADGGASGTTPFELFIKDGIVRRKP